MPNRLIDLDDDLLAAAQRELNTTGVSDTVPLTIVLPCRASSGANTAAKSASDVLVNARGQL